MITDRPAVIVLAGGRAERLGGASKPDVRIGATTLLERVLNAAAAGIADAVGPPEPAPVRTVVVGPPSLVSTPTPAALAVRVVLEDPPFGGPVAGIAAGLAALDAWPARHGPTGGPPGGAPEAPVLVLACDLPFVSTAVGPLLARFAALDTDEDGVCAEHDGRLQWLAAAYRGASLRRAVRALNTVRDTSVRRLVAPLQLVGVPGIDARDLDTWDAIEQARAELGQPPPDGGPTAGTDVAESAQRMREEDR